MIITILLLPLGHIYNTTFIAQDNYQVTHRRALKDISEALEQKLSNSKDISEAQ